MKRILIVLLCAILVFAFLAGCSASNISTQKNSIQVVASIFPIYDWSREILCDDSPIQLELLLNQGVDMHSYQPTASDIVKISSCSLFLYVGGESDSWVKDVLSQNTTSESIALLSVLENNLHEEASVEGMQMEHEEAETEWDEHVWLSLKNAMTCCSALCDAFCRLDPDRSDVYQKNLSVYLEKLRTLDEEYHSVISSSDLNTILFADRFPFRYLIEDYHLQYYAAFSGCSAETEASFETVVFLANKVDELELPVILQLEDSDGTLANTVRNNTSSKNQKIMSMNSMQSLQASDSLHYLDIMKNNLDVLKQALQK
jgi:zinc transport system substrate-binding protein